MSGSRDQFAGRLRQELSAALALLFKNVKSETVNLTLPGEGEVTHFSLVPQCQSQTITFEAPPVVVHETMGTLAVETYESFSYPMLTNQSAVLETVPTVLETTATTEPCIQADDAQLGEVTFDNVRRTNMVPVPVVDYKKELTTEQLPIVSPKETRVEKMPIEKMRVRQRRRDVGDFKARGQAFPNQLWALPILKDPVPVHRFSRQVRNHFRAVLARKVEIPPANVQINRIFSRMNLALFESIQQDQQGRLVCHMKAKFIGKNWRQHDELNRESMYLVFGNRLDNNEALSALVPAGEVLEIIEEQRVAELAKREAEDNV